MRQIDFKSRGQRTVRVSRGSDLVDACFARVKLWYYECSFRSPVLLNIIESIEIGEVGWRARSKSASRTDRAVLPFEI